MNAPLKCAVIGVGHFGKFHAQKYMQLQEVDLVALSDINEKVGWGCAKECGTLFIKDYRELLGRVDAVTVATNTSAHYEVAKFFLENGVHVYVEKPITQAYWQGVELCKLADRNHLKLQVNHIERLNPALISARQKIKDIYFIECQRLSQLRKFAVDMNVISDLMIHDLDIVLSLLDSEVVNVLAEGGALLPGTIDISNARIEFASGAVASVMASRISQTSQRTVRVFHSEGYLSIDLKSGQLMFCTHQLPSQRGALENVQKLYEEVWCVEPKDTLLEGTRSFVAAVQGRGECFASAPQALAALKLAEQITENASYNRWRKSNQVVAGGPRLN